MRLTRILMFCYVLSASYGQTESTGTFGREFYIAIPKTFDDNLNRFSLLLTSNKSGTATIYIPHLGTNATRDFNQSLEYKISGDTITKVNTTVERKGIRVTTDVDVSIVVIKYPSNTWEGFLVFPAKMLSTGIFKRLFMTMDFKRLTRILMFCYVLSASYGQTESTGTFGREFYIAIPKTFDDNLNRFSLLLTSNKSGTATIYIPHLGTNATRDFNQSLEYKISGDTITKVNTTVERKGIRVTTDVDVSIVVIKYPSNTWEGFLVFPAKMLSTGYVISSYDSYYQRYKSNFLILSVHNNTDIDIHVEGSTYSASMNYLDTFLFRRNEDLSGAIVKGKKPVAIFSGHEATTIPKSCGGGEYLLEQLLAKEYFSHEFIVPTIEPKSGYVVRVFSSVQNTSVTYSNSTYNETILLSEAGNFHEIISGKEPIHVAADKPVQCMLYGTSHKYSRDGIGHPFMSVIPSIKQFTNFYHFTVSSLTAQFANFLVITARSEYIHGLRINGHRLRNLFRSYNISGYNERFSVNVYNISVGVYHLQHVNDNTFGAMQYGFKPSYPYAYGYVLGMNTVNDCGNLNAPINGQVEIPNDTIIGSQAVYSCGSGYALQGDKNRQCLADGHWNGSQPVCKPVDCGRLNVPTYGKVDTSNGTNVGSQAVYSCESGHALHGDHNRHCLADGHWNGSQPTCKQVGGRLSCIDCKDMTHLYLCDTVTACSDGQVCYVETFRTSGGQVKYHSGCADSQQCSSWKRGLHKRSSECAHCCSSQLCNVNGCGGQGLPAADLRGPLCYECAYVSSMEECKTVKLCAQNECISHKRSFTQYASSVRTARSTPVCQNCCSSDLCNTNCNVTSQGGNGAAIIG